MLGLIDAGKHVKKYADLTPVDGYYFGDGAITMDQKTADDDDDVTELSALDDASIWRWLHGLCDWRTALRHRLGRQMRHVGPAGVNLEQHGDCS